MSVLLEIKATRADEEQKQQDKRVSLSLGSMSGQELTLNCLKRDEHIKKQIIFL